MKIHSTQTLETTPEALADALFSAAPEEFAAVWLAFAQIVRKAEGDRLDEFARAMAPKQGGLCKEPIKRLVDLIAFHEECDRRAEAEG